MATTAEQIAALETALARGVLEVTEAGRTVRYAGPRELTAALATLKARQRRGRPFGILKHKTPVE